MTTRGLALLTALALFACNSETPKSTTATKDSLPAPAIQDSSSTATPPTTSVVEQEVDLPFLRMEDTEIKIKKRNPAFKPADLQVDTILNRLNRAYPKVQLTKVDMKDGKLSLKIADSQFLTEQMGTTGAAIYLAEAIINLTEIKAIKKVKIDMEEGSHAGPGVWTAKDFAEYKEKK